MGISKRIGRKVTEIVCNVVVIDDDNDVSERVVSLYGDITRDDRIQNAVRRKLGTQRAVVKSSTKKSKWVSMPLETFLANADVCIDYDQKSATEAED